MDATITHSTLSLLPLLVNDYQTIRFTRGDDFHWSSTSSTVFYSESPHQNEFLLHEVAHSLLGHADYTRDIGLIQCERDAWQTANEHLAKKYSYAIDEELIQDNLDTYREWLHARSTCPNCQTTGIQTGREEYTCPGCRYEWKVNEARNCDLRRYSLMT